MSKVFLLIPTIPKVYQPSRFIIAHAKSVTTRTYICIQLLMYNSCRNHAKLTIPPHIISSQQARLGTIAATAMPVTIVFCTYQQQHQPPQAFTATYQFKNHKNIPQNSLQTQ